MAHIIAKRDAEGGNGQEVAYELVNVLAKGTEIETQRVQNISGNDRIRIFYNNYTAVLSESPEGNRWLLTGWENKEETTTSANGEVRDSSKATTVTPTLTRRNRAVVVSKISISNPDEKSITNFPFLKRRRIALTVCFQKRRRHKKTPPTAEGAVYYMRLKIIISRITPLGSNSPTSLCPLITVTI